MSASAELSLNARLPRASRAARGRDPLAVAPQEAAQESLALLAAAAIVIGSAVTAVTAVTAASILRFCRRRSFGSRGIYCRRCRRSAVSVVIAVEHICGASNTAKHIEFGFRA